MASLISFTSKTCFTSPPPLSVCSAVATPAVRFSDGLRRRRWSVVTRAVPGPNTYIFAFVFPLSLLVATVFTSIRIADKLDEDYLQELAVNQAILEASEDSEDEDTSVKQEPERTRTRNRPKREAEASS